MNSVDSSLLETLSPKQIQFSGTFLKDVFLNEKKGLEDFTEDELSTISTLISSVKEARMKTSIIAALSEETVNVLYSSFTEKELTSLFLGHDSFTYLSSIFKSLPEEQQTTLLTDLFNHHKNKYTEFKLLLPYKVSMLGGILVRQDQVLKKFLEREKHIILDLFESESKTIDDIKTLSETFGKKYDLEDLELLCQELVTTFTVKKIALSDATTFNIYLKFFYFIDPFVSKFEALQLSIKPLLDVVLMTLKAMPNIEWAIKVLNQLPPGVLQSCLRLLKTHPTLSQFEKRQSYSKLLKDIEKHCFSDDGENIRFAFSQL